jgi:1-deoxy-D-xylulose-5-phosphate reductoisomerase
LQGQQRGQVRRIILTASGGPFSRMDPAALECVTPEEALRHPTWHMGPKITVDCATLMNKGLEVIEARWFFDLPAAQIDIVIHHQSIIHSMVEFSDGAVLAQMGWPTMTLPIQYGLLYPERALTPTEPLDLASVATLTFAQPDFRKFPALGLARKALEAARNYPAALSAANEVAVGAFLAREIGFMQIPAIVEHALDRHEPSDESDLDAVLAADSSARQAAQLWIVAHRP